jgi:hypothetical protein
MGGETDICKKSRICEKKANFVITLFEAVITYAARLPLRQGVAAESGVRTTQSRARHPA